MAKIKFDDAYKNIQLLKQRLRVSDSSRNPFVRHEQKIVANSAAQKMALPNFLRNSQIHKLMLKMANSSKYHRLQAELQL